MRRSVICRPKLSRRVILAGLNLPGLTKLAWRKLDASVKKTDASVLKNKTARIQRWNRAHAENPHISGESLLSKRGRQGRFRPNPESPKLHGTSPLRPWVNSPVGRRGRSYVYSLCLYENKRNSVESCRANRVEERSLPILFL